MSAANTRRSRASAGMFLIQCVHDPLAPCSSTSGRPSPHCRQTMWPAPHGTLVRAAPASSAARLLIEPDFLHAAVVVDAVMRHEVLHVRPDREVIDAPAHDGA